MRTFARVVTSKGLTCANCGQKAYEMHNVNDCVQALEARRIKLMSMGMIEDKICWCGEELTDEHRAMGCKV